MYRTIVAMPMLLVFSVSSAAATFDVRQYGAIGDGKSVDTDAMQATLDACAAAGGGRVVVPPGSYLYGRLLIPGHVTFELEAGAMIQGSNCRIVAGDDCIVVKTRDGHPCEDIVVTNSWKRGIAGHICRVRPAAKPVGFGDTRQVSATGSLERLHVERNQPPYAHGRPEGGQEETVSLGPGGRPCKEFSSQAPGDEGGD